MPEEILDLIRSISVDEIPSPYFSLMRSTGMPYSYSPRLPRMQRRIREDLARTSNNSAPPATAFSAFLFAERKVIRHNGRILIRWWCNRVLWKDVYTCVVASVGEHYMEPTGLLPF